LTRWLILRVTD